MRIRQVDLSGKQECTSGSYVLYTAASKNYGLSYSDKIERSHKKPDLFEEAPAFIEMLRLYRNR